MIPGLQPNEAGSTIAGRYRVERVLGRGGFGVVYEATDLSLGRPVAVKVLRGDLFGRPEVVSRFRREAALSQRLEHPNTIRVYDTGVSEDGVVFIVFEVLRGRTLGDLVHAEGALPLERVARIASQVLLSLSNAHAAGIVHRDIKPSNVFLCDFQGAPEFVKVLDFGIAKAAQSDEDPTAHLTSTGELLGTPRYMAPEQARGKGIAPPSDLYALGLLLSEALAGKPVYTGAALEVCMEQLSPAPPPHLPEVLACPLGPVIARATQKVATNRFQSAEEMRLAIEAAMASPAARGKVVAGAAPAAMPGAPATMHGAPATGAGHPSTGAFYGAPPPQSGQYPPQYHAPPSGPHTYTPAPQAGMTAPPHSYVPGMPPPTWGGAAPMSSAPVPQAPSRGPLLVIAGVVAGVLLATGVAVVVVANMGDNDTNISTTSSPKVSTGALPSEASTGAAATSTPASGGAASPRPEGLTPSQPQNGPAVAGPGPKPKLSGTTEPAATAPTETSDPSTFDINKALMSMDIAYPGAKTCTRGQKSVSVSVTVTFAPVGTASGAIVSAPLAGTAEGRCVELAFRTAKVGAFGGTKSRSATKNYMFAYGEAQPTHL